MGIAFGVVLMLALLLAAFWPATYRSTGTILIEQQEIPEDFVRSAVSSYADQRVQVISQRVMTSQPAASSRSSTVRRRAMFDARGAGRRTARTSIST
jgi:uncharacterized protein involved in exopolysaccharide biosynthesis